VQAAKASGLQGKSGYINDGKKWSIENRYITMQISEYNVPGLSAGEIKIAAMTRHQSFVVCCDESLEKLIIEFEDEYLAELFAEAVEAGVAEIFMEEDFSLDAVSDETKLEYELVKLSGDEERLEKLLKALWEEDGIDPERTRPREMSGIKRIAIVQYGSVHGIGFRSDPDQFSA
jgi:hypothetical protein